MTRNFHVRIGLGVAVALLATGFIVSSAEGATARREPNGAIRFYDDLGQDRGYAWCLKRGGRWFGSWSDCSFFTLAQCRASILGLPGGECEPNPYAAYVTPPQRSRR